MVKPGARRNVSFENRDYTTSGMDVVRAVAYPARLTSRLSWRDTPYWIWIWPWDHDTALLRPSRMTSKTTGWETLERYMCAIRREPEIESVNALRM